MASVNAPRGLQLAKKNGDGSNSTGIRTIDLNGASPAVASALIPSDIFTGDPVFIESAGTIKPSTNNNIKIAGVFQGIQFVNASGEIVDLGVDSDATSSNFGGLLPPGAQITEKTHEFKKEEKGKVIRSDFPTQAQEVFDVSGAGDTVIASIAAALSTGLDITSAVKLANVAAGVQKPKYF